MADQVYTIEKLVAGGMGIVRDQAQTIFVPFVVPGEQVKIRIAPGARKPIRAEVKELISSSPDRVEPACPVFTGCGGCQLQHVAYSRQLQLKNEILAETLARLAKIQAEISAILPSPKPYHYRNRLKLQIQNGKPGFFAEEKKEFVAIEYCHLAEEAVNRAISSLAELIRQEQPRTIEAICEAGGALAAVIESKRGPKIFSREDEKWRASPEKKIAFQQVNPAQNLKLRETISALAQEIKPQGIIELYAGAGNLTEILLPHGAWIVAVEADRMAGELAQSRFSCVSPAPVNFFIQKAEDFLAGEWAKKLNPDLILLDPPRTGAKAVIPPIIALKPRHIIYVSCDPASLARDLKELIFADYQLRSITPLDMFPQTAHVEAVAMLSR